jgi:FAD/FMN-containing dehydrogenase/Fe-S oxidoreductase
MSDALRRELEESIDGEVRFDPLTRALYATDASVYRIPPLGVVVVRSREDVIRTVAAAGRHGVSITARGGGTSQAGQAVGAGLQLDTSKHFNRVLEIDVERRRARVEPGIVLDDLNARLRPAGLRFAPDVSTASRATIGGMIANNSSGARSVLYGKTIDHVLELEVVLADGRTACLAPLAAGDLDRACGAPGAEGEAYRTVRRVAHECAPEIERRFPRVMRRVGGYNLDAFVDPSAAFDLSRIIVGSEGTLALVVAATINLVPLPRAKAVLTIEFDDLLDALAATPAILRHRPSAVEVMDRFILDHARQSPALDRLRRAVLLGEPGALLCVELYADRPDELPPRLEALERELAAAGVRCRSNRATAAADQARIWKLREAALGLSMAMKGDDKSLSFVEDTAVAPDRLRDYIERFLEIVRRHGTVAGVYAHASVGCLHVRPVINLKSPQGVRRFEAIANDVADLVLEFGGALSGEHGDGLVRGPFTERMFGPVLYEAFRTVKRAFDPQGLFNPGKIVDSPPMTANLRYGPAYVTAEPATRFDFAQYGGFGRAVEMCSGVGACRKTLDGTMCPSYMATRDEQHSTRGRANALREFLSPGAPGGGREAGADTGPAAGPGALSDADVFAALDLCLGCRACRSECPVGVDVARFKSEFLADYWTRHAVPWRVRALGRVHTLARWSSRVAPLANGLAGLAVARRAGQRLLGIDARRRLPRWTRATFVRQFAARPGRDHAPSVILFNDTFTNHCHPEIGLAAADLLEAAGRAVRLVRHRCCGRPQISQGLLDEARALAAANAEALYEAAARREPIVFLEPSCLSAVREDAPALLGGEAARKARAVADASMLFEEYVEQTWQRGGLALRLRPGPARVLFHGHCHQKAMGLAAPAQALLARIPSCEVEDLDAGCCGMAGSFGYAPEHFDVSRRIGERRLLPAARAMQPGTVLVASGTSCRQQVLDFTGATAVHPAVLLRTLLEER